MVPGVNNEIPGYQEQIWTGLKGGIYDGVVGTLSFFCPIKWYKMAKGFVFMVAHPLIVGQAIKNALYERPVELPIRLAVGFVTGRAALGAGAEALKLASQYQTLTVGTTVVSKVAPLFQALSDSFAEVQKLAKQISSYSQFYDHATHSQKLAKALESFKNLTNKLGVQLDVDLTSQVWADISHQTKKLSNAGALLHTNKHGKAMGALSEISKKVMGVTSQLERGLTVAKPTLTTTTSIAQAVQTGIKNTQHLYNGAVLRPVQAAFAAHNLEELLHLQGGEGGEFHVDEQPVEEAHELDRDAIRQRELPHLEGGEGGEFHVDEQPVEEAHELDRDAIRQRELIAERIRFQEHFREDIERLHQQH